MINPVEKPFGFCGHLESELDQLLESINECELPIEVLDAFLFAYRKTGDLHQSRAFAAEEWDC